ncbi:Uncharacterised protein [Chlamydia trachomatis]|nr:Uncharacterised protein [Chlamydia trachomatis]
MFVCTCDVEYDHTCTCLYVYVAVCMTMCTQAHVRFLTSTQQNVPYTF